MISVSPRRLKANAAQILEIPNSAPFFLAGRSNYKSQAPY